MQILSGLLCNDTYMGDSLADDVVSFRNGFELFNFRRLCFLELQYVYIFCHDEMQVAVV